VAALPVYAQGPDGIAEGKRMFARQCAPCHGAAGEGGRGPVLRPGRSDRELFDIVRKGIPNSEMPASAQTDEELWRLVAFVQQVSVEAGASEVFRGDAVAGKPVFVSEGCGVCHRIDGEGGNVGPDLSRAGSRSARFLKESIVNPDAYVPEGYRAVTVTLVAGPPVRGALLAEDGNSIQLRDMTGKVRSIPKADVKEVRRETASLMPAYVMPSTDMDNLVAYLSSLKGKK
jgi:putative heme-binding domain-containing protein